MSPLKYFAAACEANSSFLGFPNWYRGLECDGTSPVLTGFGDIWKILANIIEIVLRIGALLAIIFIIIGGVMYITSRGEPDQISRAKSIIVNALVGLVIAVLATVIVGFIARSVGG